MSNTNTNTNTNNTSLLRFHTNIPSNLPSSSWTYSSGRRNRNNNNNSSSSSRGNNHEVRPSAHQELREKKHRQGLRQSLFMHTSPHHLLAVSHEAGPILDPDVAVDWAHVRLVTCISSATSESADSHFLASTQCPICLEDTCIAPRITRCGHVFCFTCILAHFYTDNKLRCPCCSQPSMLDEWRPAQFCTVQYPQRGNTMAFTLTPFYRTHYVDADELLAKLRSDVQQLQQIHNDNAYASMAIQAIRSEIHMATLEAQSYLKETQIPKQKIDYNVTQQQPVYQAADGQMCFLSELNMQCLAAEFRRDNDTTYPTHIQGQILHVSRVHVTPQVRHKLQLTHLPLYTDVTLVELNLHHILSAQTKLLFKTQLDMRRKERQDWKKRENRNKNTHPTNIMTTTPIDSQPHTWIPPISTLTIDDDDFGPPLPTSNERKISAANPNPKPKPTKSNNNAATAPEFSYRTVCKSGGLFPSLPTAHKS